MNKLLYRDNSIYRFTECQPYMDNINQYIICYDKYTVLHYARRTAGDKYSCVHSKHLFLVDVSNVEISSRTSFIKENWSSFVCQIIDYDTNNLKLEDDLLDMHPLTYYENYSLKTLYTIQNPVEYKYPTIFHMYGAILLWLDIPPSTLSLQVWSGYDSRNNNEIQYYNAQNFNADIMVSHKF